jgi:RNA polymerase-interacting CarD/CdnL/TRCF family regulator
MAKDKNHNSVRFIMPKNHPSHESIPEEVYLDMIDVLDHVKDALERQDVNDLSEWSDHIIHTAAIYREQHAIYIAMIAYSLAKVVEKQKVKREYSNEWGSFIGSTKELIEKTIAVLEKRDMGAADNFIKDVLKKIVDFDAAFSEYAQHVLEFSKIQKGTKIYEHGLSLSAVAEMLGISKWELMRKVGERKTPDGDHIFTKTPKERLEQLKKLVKK